MFTKIRGSSCLHHISHATRELRQQRDHNTPAPPPHGFFGVFLGWEAEGGVSIGLVGFGGGFPVWASPFSCRDRMRNFSSLWLSSTSVNLFPTLVTSARMWSREPLIFRNSSDIHVLNSSRVLASVKAGSTLVDIYTSSLDIFHQRLQVSFSHYFLFAWRAFFPIPSLMIVRSGIFNTRVYGNYQ